MFLSFCLLSLLFGLLNSAMVSLTFMSHSVRYTCAHTQTHTHLHIYDIHGYPMYNIWELTLVAKPGTEETVLPKVNYQGELERLRKPQPKAPRCLVNLVNTSCCYGKRHMCPSDSDTVNFLLFPPPISESCLSQSVVSPQRSGIAQSCHLGHQVDELSDMWHSLIL